MGRAGQAWVQGFACGTVLLLAGCAVNTGGAQPASREARLEAQINLARGYLESADPTRARAPLDRALAIEPGSADALGLYAVYYLRENEPELAEQYYKRALRADPDHAPTLNNYAALLVAQARYREALTPLRRLVADTAYRGRQLAFVNMGLALRQLGDMEAARDAFERAAALDPAQPDAELALAELDLAAGRAESARRHYEVYRANARPTAASLCVGIRLSRALGDADELASQRLSLRRLFPDAPENTNCETTP
ncbi:MAG: type IV pilus biogenesis/stability protein PilW [Gammaproteobacteria bacterium]